MTENFDNLNRQAQRSIQALQAALVELMKEQPYQKISITELAERSGLTRSTFYAHFETKEQLLDSVINSVLDDFFTQLKSFYGKDSDCLLYTSDAADE